MLINNLIKMKKEIEIIKDNYNKKRETALSIMKEIVNNLNTLSQKDIDKKILDIIDISDCQEKKIFYPQYIMSSFPFELAMNKISFTVHNFSLVVKKKWENNLPINSPIYIVDYLSWKLSIILWKKKENKDIYISIYLYLSEGKSENKYCYLYKFEITNYKGKDNFYTQWCIHVFENNRQGHGCHVCYKLDDIEQNGFIDDQDNFTINCYIKPDSIKEITKAVGV